MDSGRIRAYALATLRAAEKAGADVVTLCDTNGGSLPGDVAAVTRIAREALLARIGIHTHDDIGLGVANALAALEAGATHVQGTINGYGERTGNCNITSVIPILHFKLNKRGVPVDSLPRLTELSQFVDETANLRPNPRLPWVGSRGVLAQGRHARQRGREGAEQLRARRPGFRRQHAPRADQRPRRTQQHRHEGEGARLRSVGRYRAAEDDARGDQGSGASRLRVRSRGRIADAVDPACVLECSAAVHGRCVPRVDAVGGNVRRSARRR